MVVKLHGWLRAVETVSFEEILSNIQPGGEEMQSSSAGNQADVLEVSSDEESEDAVITQTEALACIRKLRSFCAAKAPSAFTLLCTTEAAIEREMLSASMKQTTLPTYFHPI